MGWAELILGAITAVFASIPIFYKIFKKSPDEKVRERYEDIDEEVDKIRKIKRPGSH